MMSRPYQAGNGSVCGLLKSVLHLLPRPLPRGCVLSTGLCPPRASRMIHPLSVRLARNAVLSEDLLRSNMVHATI